MQDDRQLISAAPTGAGPQGEDDAARLADEAMAQWDAIVSALSPIIGARGVDALYRRTLFLGQASFAWIELPAESRPMDLEGLRSTLRRREPAEAAQASASLFCLFHDLLASLIGPSLAQRLLPAGLPTLSARVPAAQDAPHA